MTFPYAGTFSASIPFLQRSSIKIFHLRPLLRGSYHPRMKKPFTTIAIGLFVLIALLHVVRLLFQWEVAVNGVIIPLWVSLIGFIISGALAVMVYLECR